MYSRLRHQLVIGQIHAPAAFPSRKPSPLFMDWETGWGPVKGLNVNILSIVGNPIPIPCPSSRHPSRYFCCRLSHDLT